MCKLNIKNQITNEIRTINNAKALDDKTVFCLYAGGKFRKCWYNILQFNTDATTEATATLMKPWVIDDDTTTIEKPESEKEIRYEQFKREYLNTVALWRVGDCYELYNEDAELSGKVLGLTVKDNFKEVKHFAGFHRDSIATYLPMLTKGYRVAICDGDNVEVTEPRRVEEKPQETPVQQPKQPKDDNNKPEKTDAISAAFRPLVEGVAGLVKNQILDEIKPLIDAAAKESSATATIEIKTIEGTRKVEGVQHKKLNEILPLIYNDIPVYLFGPAGTGKSHAAKQAAKAFGYSFHYSTTVQNVYELTGFIDAGGVYHTTEFREAFENGGVFMLDELDASCPEALVCLNTAIANRYFAFPDHPVTAHKDFRVIAAGNTVGTGANEEYTGRAVIDASTLNRFARIYWGYSDKIEKTLTTDVEIINFAHEMRRIKREFNLTGVIFSYREISRLDAAARMFADNKTALSIAFTGGLSQDIITTLAGQCKLDSKRNPWAQALKDIADNPEERDF